MFIDKLALMSTTNGEKFNMPVDLVICTAGMQPSSLVENLPLLKDKSGRLLIKPTLQCKSYPYIFALGDCSSIDGVKLASTAQVAMQQSNIVAQNLMIRSNLTQSDNKVLEVFRYIPLGEMLTLGGTTAAAVTGLGGLIKLDGLAADAARRVVYAYRMPTPKQALNSLFGASLNLVGNVVSDFIEKEKKL